MLLQDALTSRDHLVVIFPVVLLCMRVVLETILRNTFVSIFDVPHISFRCCFACLCGNTRRDMCDCDV